MILTLYEAMPLPSIVVVMKKTLKFWNP